MRWSSKFKELLRPGYRRVLYSLAYVWRSLLWRTTFIAITGSVGKSTTKECLAAILGAHFPVGKSLHNQNGGRGVPRSLLRIRPWHRFAVIEVGTDRPGLIRRSARLVRPHIAIVLSIARTHTDVFRTLEDTANEKAQLLESLPPEGLAILNADDVRVRQMALRCRCKVKTFGRQVGCDLWAEESSSRWPERLSVRVANQSGTHRVKTSLVGEHWVHSVLAALLAAVACGIDLKTAAGALQRVKPFTARLQPVLMPNGAIFLRDERNGSPDTLKVALQVLKESSAERKILVISDISDSRDKSRVRFRDLGKMAAQVCDLAVFVGVHGHRAVNAARAAGMSPECAVDFIDIYTTTQYLRSELRNGDLVLLRGRGTDHLSRIFFGQLGTIGCWKRKCEKTIVCDICSELRPEFDIRQLQYL